MACLLLSMAAPAMARQATMSIAATPAQVPAVRTYDDCTRAYAARRDVLSYCRRLFPATPAVTSYDTCVQAMGRTAESRKLCAQRYPDTAPKAAEPVDLTPVINTLIESWNNRPKPSKPAPADPLAVVPGIQAACAPWAGNAERWLRCTADGWRDTGLRGKPPLALQTPPTPPPIEARPVVPEPTDQTPPPPVKPAPPPVVTPAAPEPPVAIQPRPPVDVVPPPVPPKPAPPPAPPPSSSIPFWVWILAAVAALVAAGAGGFGLSRWLARPRPPSPPKAEVPPCAPPQIALVPDLGVVVLTPDGPPRAGLAVSMRFVPDPDEGEVRLDYPSLETAP